MKVAMIGGTGQLGHFVLKHLAKRGHQTLAIGIGTKPEPGFLPTDAECLIQDISDLSVGQLMEIFHGVDVVIHGAGADGRNLFNKPAITGFRKENVDPFHQLVKAMKQAGSKKIVILGSYYTAVQRMFPELQVSKISPYIQSRCEQNELVYKLAGNDLDVAIMELPYIFGAAPNRGTLWGFYINKIMNATDVIPVHSGGTACITMNQVGAATAAACEVNEGHRNYPLCNSNHSYEDIFRMFADELGVARDFRREPPVFFKPQAEAQKSKMDAEGKEAAYDPLGLLEMEHKDLYLDPLPSMQVLAFGQEDMRLAIRETIDATLKFAGQGPGSKTT